MVNAQTTDHSEPWKPVRHAQVCQKKKSNMFVACSPRHEAKKLFFPAKCLLEVSRNDKNAITGGTWFIVALTISFLHGPEKHAAMKHQVATNRC